MNLSPEEIVGIVAGTTGILYLGNLGAKAVKKHFANKYIPNEDQSFEKLDEQARNYVGKTVEFKGDKIKEVSNSQGNKVNLARALTLPFKEMINASKNIKYTRLFR